MPVGSALKIKQEVASFFSGFTSVNMLLETADGTSILRIRLRGGRLFQIDRLHPGAIDMRAVAVLLVVFATKPTRSRSD